MPAVKVSWKWISFLIIIASLFLQWYAHACGLLVTDDSLNYLSAAKNFSQSYQLINTDGTPYVNWPPLFPVLLSFFDEPLLTMRWVNFFLTAVIGLMLAHLSEKMIHRPFIRAIYLFLQLCGVHFIMNTVFLWSEMIFMMLTISFVFFVEQAKESNRSAVMSMALGVLLCLQRNAGLFIIVGAMLWYLYCDTTAWKYKIRKAVVFFMISTSGFWLWNLWISYGTVSSFRISEQAFFLHVGHNLNSIAGALVTAYVPFKSWSIVLLLLLVIVLAFVLRENFKDNAMLQLMSFVIVSYVAGMAFLFRIDYAADNDRYVSIILPYLGLILFSALDKILSTKTKVIQYVVIALLLIWLSYPMGRTIKNVMQWHNVSCAK